LKLFETKISFTFKEVSYEFSYSKAFGFTKLINLDLKRFIGLGQTLYNAEYSLTQGDKPVQAGVLGL
jgi:hypothetical protein